MAEEIKTKMTRAGYEKKLKELNERRVERRNSIAEQIKYAKSLGDFSENAELDAAKEAENENEKIIDRLTHELENVEIIPATRYKVYDMADKEEVEYVLVGDTESSLLENLISMESPFGRAVSGSKVGDVVTVKVSAQDGYQVKILDIIKE